jgi:hypothetical protein
MSEITIAGKQFSVRNPYDAGHSLTEGEASAMNQLRHENVRNNCAKLVKDWTGAEDELASKVDEYDEAYAFNVRAEGGARVPSDPVTTEAKAIARDAIKQQAEKQGLKYDAKQVAAAVEVLLSNPQTAPNFRAAAEKRIAERKAAASSLLEGLDLAALTPPASPASVTGEAVA